jgi:uncharacterized delta-60 repeat protein
VIVPGAGRHLVGLAAALPLALAGLLPQPQAVSASAAGLDPSFGSGGRASFPLAFEAPAKYRPTPLALAQDGGLFVSNGAIVRHLDPNGGLDPSFAEGGVLTPSVPSGVKFEVRGLAVDSLGRLVLAGTSTLPTEQFQPPISLQSAFGPFAARIARYQPSGSADSTFGSGGALETDLDLPPPREEKGNQLLGKSWVEATGVAVDAQNRIVLSGGASAGALFGCAHDSFWNNLTYAAFLARFSESGSLDSSFGSGGVFGGRSTTENPLQLEFSGSPQFGRSGEVLYTGGGVVNCPRNGGRGGVAELTDTGATEAGFGTQGAVTGSTIQVAPGPDGSLTLLEGIPWRKGEKHRMRVTRVTATGGPDPSFGSSGSTLLTIPGDPFHSGLSSIAIDREGGVLLAGSVTKCRKLKRHRHRPRTSCQRHWTLQRLTQSGQLDPSFAKAGTISTRFSPLTVGAPALLLDSQGRALLVGRYRQGKQVGIAAARYLLGG